MNSLPPYCKRHTDAVEAPQACSIKKQLQQLTSTIAFQRLHHHTRYTSGRSIHRRHGVLKSQTEILPLSSTPLPLDTPASNRRSTNCPLLLPTNTNGNAAPDLRPPLQPHKFYHRRIPISAASPSRGLPGYDHREARRTPIPDEKAFEAQMHSPPPRAHPAFSAPIAEPAHIPRQNVRNNRTPPAAPQPTPPNPPLSPGPLPVKAPQGYSASTTPATVSTIFPDPNMGIERRETYNPNALQGPNVGDVNHRPGQVSHPNASVDPHWKHGLCEPDTLCCMSVFCPCMLYGRTMYRLSRKSEKKDPTDLLGYESCNGSCGLFAIGCGLQGLSISPLPPSLVFSTTPCKGPTLTSHDYDRIAGGHPPHSRTQIV